LFIAGDNQNGVGGGISSTSFTDSNQNNVYQVLNADGYYYGSPTRYAHGHYLNTSGELYGVGGNAAGSVGDGTLVAKGTWTRIGGSATYSSVYYAGNAYYLTVAALGGTPGSANQSVYHWGYNGTSQVGDGTTTNAQSPIQPSTTTLYTHTTTSTTSNNAATETDVALPVNNIIKVWGCRGGQGQTTGHFFLMDDKYRIWIGGHSQAEDYFQTSTASTAIANYRLDIGPWNTTSSITTSHWAGKTEEQVVHMHPFGNSYGSEGHMVLWTTTGRMFGKRYNAHGQLADGGLNYFGNWRQLTP
jgi:alpha-tubulin suppressor-like RCC1 family protein